MQEYALLINNVFQEIRSYNFKPQDISHKKVTWHNVIREQGETAFTGLENGNWVIRTALPTLEKMKIKKIGWLANTRWEKETGGIVYNSMPIATDINSQTKYIGAVLATQLSPLITVNWKLSDGTFVTLDATAITEIAMAVRSYVQACFDREAELKALIEAAADKEELDSIDIHEGWPS